MRTDKVETVTIGGVNYPVTDLSANLAISTSFQDGDLIINANIRLIPFLVLNGKRVVVDLPQRVIMMNDILHTKDTDAMACVSKIDEALQEYVLAKGI